MWTRAFECLRNYWARSVAPQNECRGLVARRDKKWGAKTPQYRSDRGDITYIDCEGEGKVVRFRKTARCRWSHWGIFSPCKLRGSNEPGGHDVGCPLCRSAG